MVGALLEEPLIIHRLCGDARARRQRVRELLDLVGLPANSESRYPHEFSGGQRQRIGLARALAVEPDFLVCDEPVSALDVSIQAQILNLLMDLQEHLGLTYLLISHDLRVVEHLSHWIAVMRLGEIVEIGEAGAVCSNPQHPYTQALLSAVLNPDPRERRERIVLSGEPGSALHQTAGCPFQSRCFRAEARCLREAPKLMRVKNGGGRQAACLLVDSE